MSSTQARPISLPNDRSEWEAFPAFLAHEVRGPLSVILGNTRLLQRLWTSDDVTRQSLEDIREEAEKLRRILDGLLALFGKRHLESEPISTSVVMKSIVELFHREHPTRTVNLALNSDSFALGVQSYLEEIVENLLSIADKYSPPGERIDVEVQDSWRGVTISVSDRGQGIGPADAEKIFGLFVRLDETVGPPGHGIGLALSRRLAEEMDGELTFESPPKGGSRFCLRLPAEEALVLDAI